VFLLPHWSLLHWKKIFLSVSGHFRVRSSFLIVIIFSVGSNAVATYTGNNHACLQHKRFHWQWSRSTNLWIECRLIMYSSNLEYPEKTTNLSQVTDKVWQWLVTGRWLSLDTPVSSTNKTDRHDITEILLKVALNTITLTFKIGYYVNYMKILFYLRPFF
jgi:hypothetical protein